MHTVFEGVAVYHLNQLLHYLIDTRKWLSLTEMLFKHITMATQSGMHVAHTQGKMMCYILLFLTTNTATL